MLERDTVGGISLNFAVNARRSGAGRVALVSCTGNDAAGSAVRKVLANEGVDVTHVHTLTGATATQDIVVSDVGERSFPPGGYRPGVLSTFRLAPSDLDFIGTFDVVVAPYFRQIEHLFHPAMQGAAKSAKRVADLLDGEDLGAGLTGLDALLEVTDLLFISGPKSMADEFVGRSENSRTVLVVTHGAEGSSALSDGRWHFEPAVAVSAEQCIDTTGCGDAFQAAFTVEYFRRGDIADALRAGARRASQVIQHLGAVGA